MLPSGSLLVKSKIAMVITSGLAFGTLAEPASSSEASSSGLSAPVALGTGEACTGLSPLSMVTTGFGLAGWSDALELCES